VSIAIVGGTGPEGRGLAQRWARAGEHVIIGSRDGQRARNIAAEVAAQLGGSTNISGAENAEAVACADVVVLAVPFAGHADTLKKLKTAFRPNATVIDATVPLAAEIGGRPTRVIGVWQGSAAQQTAELVPPGVAVAAAFHNISAELLHGDQPVECDVLVCTDSEPARKIASQLALKIPGVRAIDAGKLENARIVEQITALLITINIRAKVHSAGIRITGVPAEQGGSAGFSLGDLCRTKADASPRPE
jgi:NADPH-dependent F420 reductase